MKLYFSPGACSLASHISLREAAIPFELVRVDLSTKRTADGRDFHLVNPKGYVPALELKTGLVLTESAAVLQYIADQAPALCLAPPAGTMPRYRMQEWLSFIASELHKVFTPFFDPTATAESQSAARGKLAGRLGWLASCLSEPRFLLGDAFSVADAYLFVILRACEAADIDIHDWAPLSQYHARVSARTHVASALAAEGLA